MHTHPQAAPDRAGSAALQPADASIRVVLADEHALMRRSLRLLLDADPRVEVVAEAEDLPAVTQHVHRHRPGVLVIDLSMSNGSSIEAVRRLREQVSTTEIVVLTMEESAVFAQEALDAGAVGFVLKQAAHAELPQAVKTAARGRRYLSPRLAKRRASVRRSADEDGLSAGETEVLRLIALGHTSAEIEGELHLSAVAVETDRAHIFRELGLATSTEIAQHALRRGLLET